MITNVHLIHPFHSRPTYERWSHCAFTQIALKQARVFRALGCRVISYGNHGDESDADERVTVLEAGEAGPPERYATHYADTGLPGHGANGAVIGSPGHAAWLARLLPEVLKRAIDSSSEHVVCHTFADSAALLVQACPTALHLEPHVGYDRAPFGARRVYVSQAWRHHQWGKHGSTVGDHRYSWVVLPYYDPAAWPFVQDPSQFVSPYVTGQLGDKRQPYAAYLGRMTNDKGLSTVVEVAKKLPLLRFKLAGSGTTPEAFARDYQPPPNVEYLGTLPGRDRAAFLGNASVLLCPSEYVEPCAGVVCEAALCGTPSVVSSWGGYTETVQDGTGCHAATLAEWLSGVKDAMNIHRPFVRQEALRRFTLEAAAPQYGRVLEQLLSLRGTGWYTLPEADRG